MRIDDYFGEAKEVLALITQSTPEWAEKIIIKSRKEELDYFLSNGFQQEAFIAGYFKGVDMFFIVKYLSPLRAINSKQTAEQEIIDKLLKEARSNDPVDCGDVSLATEQDADELTQLYASTFNYYPTPIGESGYVLKTMNAGTIYVVAREQNKIVSAASAEIVGEFSNAELTDCATLPEVQGKGYMKKLLCKLEEILLQQNVHCLYTIARSESYSMNKVFYQLRYTYGGRMTNNCYIYSGLEDMNVWYKLI